MKRFRAACPILSLFLCGCGIRPESNLAANSPQCASTLFPRNDQIAAWSVDKFAGRYTRGPDALTVRRDQHRLVVEGWTLGTRQLSAQSAESWTWNDGCGARYEFTLPPDGPGAWLKIVMPDGSTTDWHR
jgi:hypothetical protein